jgi:CRP-like cAMP-binding protein
VNRITALEASDATRVTDESGMCQLAREYFEELFQGQQSIYSPVISALQPIVTDVDNLELTEPF